MLVQHNIPLSLADELTPLFQDVFSDSEIVKNFSSRRMKVACIINGAIAPSYQQVLVEAMKNGPYSVAVDGSSDNGVEKMNLLQCGSSMLSCMVHCKVPLTSMKFHGQTVSGLLWTTP